MLFYFQMFFSHSLMQRILQSIPIVYTQILSKKVDLWVFFTCETSEKIDKLTFKCFNRIFLYDKTKRLGSSVEKIQKSSTEQEMGIRSIWEKHTTQFNWRFHNELSWNFVAINAFSEREKILEKTSHNFLSLYREHLYTIV